MRPQTHPEPATLISYAAGTLPNAIACVVACHAELCRECADHIKWLEALGGVMLNKLDAAPSDPALAERAAERALGDDTPPLLLLRPPRPSIDDPVLPKPLTRHLGVGGEEIPWRTLAKGVRQHWIKLPRGSGQLRLLRLAPGKLLLEHTHTGMELTLVLKGIYGDHTGEYRRGDVIEWTEGTLHQPHSSGDEDCVCLVASENTPRFSRLAARLLRPFLGF